MKEIKKVEFFDTTLRDGQQCPGAGIIEDKNYFKYIELVSKAGIDIIEAGYPSANETEYNRVNMASQISQDEYSPIIAGLCQLRKGLVEKTIRSLEPGINLGKSMLHTYFPVDPILMKASVGEIDKEKIITNIYDFIKMSVDEGMIVQFSPEGYSQVGNNFDFCTDLILAAIEAGAKYINCPDTKGSASRFEGEKYYLENIIKHKNIIDKKVLNNNIVWSVHNHNDLGLAVDNSIEAIVNSSVTKIEGTFGQVGERAGNACLATTIMQIKNFLNDIIDISHIDTNCFVGIGKHVSKNILQIQPHYPILGENAFKHTSGGHTNAILRNPMAYHPFDPQEVGGEVSLVFGPLSGGGHAKSIIEKFGYICEKKESAQIMEHIKQYWKSRYKGITDEEVLEAYIDYKSPVKINGYNKINDKIIFNGTIFGDNNISGSGNTAFQTLKKVIESKNSSFEVINFESNSDITGADSDSISKVIIEICEKEYEGIGKNEDIELSSIKALSDAYNKYFIEKKYKFEKSRENTLG